MAKLSKYARPQQLLMHILEQPDLVQAVQAQAPEVLTKLVRHIGLEDSGELVALFTTEQLLEVFDQDLWSSESPGEDESFDDKRFALWLEVLLESGTALAARKVAEMDEDLLTLALCRQAFVINLEELERRMSDPERSDEDDLLDKELDGTLYQELEEYQVISRNHRTWETLRAVLVELDSEHHDLLTRLLARCCHISQEYIDENGGLYDVLSSDEMVESDVGAAREERREQKGYVPPSSATSFLSHARVEPLAKLMESEEVDPITRAHFRTTASGAAQPPTRVDSSEQTEARSTLLKTLTDAEVLEPPTPTKLLAAGKPAHATESDQELLVSAAMRELCERDRAIYEQRVQELAYLANVLLAGCEYNLREMRPIEAAQAALATCNLGADHLMHARNKSAQNEAEALSRQLQGTGLVKLFRIGWHLLFTQIVMPSAETLQFRLDRASDDDVRSPSGRAALALANEIKQGKPWRATSRILDSYGPEDRDSKILRALMQQLPLAWTDYTQTDKQTGLIDSQTRLQSVQTYLHTLTAPQVRPSKKTKNRPR